MKHTIITGILVTSSLVGYSQGNQADIKQNGTGNAHTVEQTGTNEKLMLLQGTGANPSNQSEASVAMMGASDEVFIRQIGSQHLANVGVAGESNTIRVDQAGFGQVANVEVTDNLYPTNNSVKINQQGETNGTEVSIQGGENHDFQIKQVGSDNVASMRQYYSSSNTFSIDQNGSSNEAYIQQESGRDGDQATIKQVGDLNTARIALADADGISPTRDNQATIRQAGNGNEAAIEQKTPNDILYTPDAPPEIALNEAVINQYGDNNTALLTQYGSENFGKIQQDGMANEATLIQAGVGDVTTLVQTGTGNVSLVAQGGALP